MTLFETDDTLTVGQLTRSLGETVRRTFQEEIWIRGQIRNLKRSSRNHVYFDLIDPVPAGAAPKASLAITLFESNRQVVNRIIKRTGNSVRIEDGVEVRIRGTLELYVARGQLQLNMTSIDPEFTLGRLGADRDHLLRDLHAQDLIEANRRVELATVPQRIALITSAGSAAHADFTQQIAGCGYRFEITTLATRVQGEFAPDEIAAALALAQASACDVIAIVRGGGAKTDLAAFDTESVALAIAKSQLPVVVGIGHEIDQSVADLVAHASLKTPTACAQFLIERVVAFDFALAERAERLHAVAMTVPYRHDMRLGAAATMLGERTRRSLDTAALANQDAAARLERRVGHRITAASDQLTKFQARLRSSADSALAGAARRCQQGERQVREFPPRVLRSESQRLDLLSARLSAVDPAQVMRRGWSITTAPDGSLIRSIEDIAPGTPLITRVLDGVIASTVVDTTCSPSDPDQESK